MGAVERLLLAAALVAVAVVVALVLERRRADPPAQVDWTVPSQLDRRDFDHPDAPWLVAVFTSATCATCASVKAAAAPLAAPDVAVVEAEAVARKDLHDRYRIEAVPTLVVADDQGVVRASFLGPVVAGDLRSTVDRLRAEAAAG
jgi:thioredoxin-related protein